MLKSYTTAGGPVFWFDSGINNVDGLGRLRQAEEVITTATPGYIDHAYGYNYDMRSQLLHSYISTGSQSALDDYEYDKAGNVQGHTYHTFQNSQQASTGFNYYNNNNSDLMHTASGGYSFSLTWNSNGNLTKKDEVTDTNLFYNWDNKLRFAQKDTSTISVKYDPQGNRVWKQSTVNGQTSTRKYIVDVSGELPTILLELDPANNMAPMKTYIYANAEILAQHDGSPAASRYFYMHDRLGSVREVISTSAQVMKHYTYGPFGQTIEESGTLANPFMFTGQYYDYEIGQYYLRARQYDPILMRMTSYDPVQGKFEEPLSLHKYLYCQNEPICRKDPLGLLFEREPFFSKPYLPYKNRHYTEAQTQDIIDQALIDTSEWWNPQV
jgi:RHS repeat-associated protein